MIFEGWRKYLSTKNLTRLTNKKARIFIKILLVKIKQAIYSKFTLEKSRSVDVWSSRKVLILPRYAHSIVSKQTSLNDGKDEKLKIAYTVFIKEYIELGHMSLSSNLDSLSVHSQAFLPHHGMWKETSTTTKLHTVFNGSSKTKSSVSVNDLLHVGPNLLQKISSL